MRINQINFAAKLASLAKEFDRRADECRQHDQERAWHVGLARAYNKAGAIVAEAFKAGALQIDGLPALVGWIDGGEAPAGMSQTAAPCLANLFTAACALVELPPDHGLFKARIEAAENERSGFDQELKAQNLRYHADGLRRFSEMVGIAAGDVWAKSKLICANSRLKPHEISSRINRENDIRSRPANQGKHPERNCNDVERAFPDKAKGLVNTIRALLPS